MAILCAGYGRRLSKGNYENEGLAWTQHRKWLPEKGSFQLRPKNVSGDEVALGFGVIFQLARDGHHLELEVRASQHGVQEELRAAIYLFIYFWNSSLELRDVLHPWRLGILGIGEQWVDGRWEGA